MCRFYKLSIASRVYYTCVFFVYLIFIETALINFGLNNIIIGVELL